MNVRMLSFATLLMAAVPAYAQDPVSAAPVEQAVEEAPLPPATIDGKWTTEVVKGVLIVKLTLVNTGTEPLDVMVARGTGPGAWMIAQLPAVPGADMIPELEAIRSKKESRDMESREGPMPTYAPIAPGAEVLVGTYKFKIPKGYTGGIHLEAQVETTSNFAVVSHEVAGTNV